MKKIPIVQTIKAAYGFVFTHLGAIIGLIWVPMVLVTVLGFFVEQRYYAAAADALASDNFARLGPSVISLLCYFVAAILLYAVMYVPVTQLALGQRKDGAIFHFALGPAEWRMFRALAGLAAFLFLPVMIMAFLFNTRRGPGGRAARPSRCWPRVGWRCCWCCRIWRWSILRCGSFSCFPRWQ